jgi:hypothetical protein
VKIIVPRKALLQFRKECRQAWPKEHLACIWGHRSADAVMVARFKEIPFTGTDGAAKYHYKDIRRSKMAALRAGFEWLGTIHSHTCLEDEAACEHLSPADVSTGLTTGEVISGVVLVYDSGKRSEMHWWEPRVPPEVEYV